MELPSHIILVVMIILGILSIKRVYDIKNNPDIHLKYLLNLNEGEKVVSNMFGYHLKFGFRVVQIFITSQERMIFRYLRRYFFNKRLDINKNQIKNIEISGDEINKGWLTQWSVKMKKVHFNLNDGSALEVLINSEGIPLLMEWFNMPNYSL